MKKWLIILVASLFLIIIIYSTFIIIRPGCTLEGKICKNGRGVGRVGPNCEFAPCELPTSLEECGSKKGFWKEWCQKDFASEVSLNPEDCENTRKSIKNDCYSEIAGKTNNLETCFKLDKFEDYCIMQFSDKSTDQAICGLLKEERDIAECFKNIGRNALDTSLCEKARGYFYGDYDFGYICLREIARKQNDTSFCNMLDELGFPEAHYKQGC